MVVRAASALGQEVGKAFEAGVLEAIRNEVETRGCSVRPARLRNGTDNVYQIDAVVFDSNRRPVIIIDPKYIRYTKHNRDKGSLNSVKTSRQKLAQSSCLRLRTLFGIKSFKYSIQASNPWQLVWRK